VLADFFQVLGQVLAWPTIGMLLVGVLVGSLVAFLPGIGSTAGLVLLLPFVLALDDPVQGIALLLGAHAVMTTADSVCAILFAIPGGAGAQALLMDGYPMNLQGRGGQALGASFTAAGLGGLIGAFALLIAIPLSTPLIKAFGSPELLVLALWGISMVGTLSGANQLKGLAMGALGLWLGSFGLDPQRGFPRYVMDSPYLLDGLSLVAMSLGLFAVPQAIELIQRRTLINVDSKRVTIDYPQVFSGVVATLRHWWLLLRSSFMGVFLGIVPGIGGSIIDWLVYGQTVAAAKDRSQFGKGDIRGVIGPDAASNSKEGGQLIPTVAFGVAGSSGMAIILSAFIGLGLQPGITMVTTRVDLTFSMVWTIVVANLIATGGLLAIAPYLARVTLIRAPVLATIIIVFSVLGAYMENRELGDIVALAVFSLVGWALKETGWPRPPLLLGFVLSLVLERYLFISLNTFGWSWLTRPGVLILFGVIVVSSVFMFRRGRKGIDDKVRQEAML
jgi:putative tricarboxylic transport membrane protein